MLLSGFHFTSDLSEEVFKLVFLLLLLVLHLLRLVDMVKNGFKHILRELLSGIPSELIKGIDVISKS